MRALSARRTVRSIQCLALGVSVVGLLSACSMSESVAIRADTGEVDIAFCDEFTATSAELEFTNYDPRETIAVLAYSGDEALLGDGVPVSTVLITWELSTTSDHFPADWDRVDFSFYDRGGNYAGGEYVFSRDATSEWHWTEGMYVNKPTCDLVD